MITLATLVGTLAPLTSAVPDVTTVPASVRSVDLNDRNAKVAVSPLSVRLTLGDVPADVAVPANLADAAYGTGKAGKRATAERQAGKRSTAEGKPGKRKAAKRKAAGPDAAARKAARSAG